MVEARKDALNWSEYFMAISLLSAKRSKDPACQVGACIVNPDKRIVGMGYNGFPTGCSDLPWEPRSEESRVGFLGTKHAYVCHAEMNAVVNALSIASLKGCTIYVTHFPCNECSKLIIQVGIIRVIFLNDLKHDTDSCHASRRLFHLSGVSYEPMPGKGRIIELNISAVSP